MVRGRANLPERDVGARAFPMIRSGVASVYRVRITRQTEAFMKISTGLHPTRRRFLSQTGLITMLPLASAWTLPSQAATGAGQETVPSGPLTFTAYRNGSRLGFHSIAFAKVDERLVVDIEIAFDVKLAFIPLYRYRHTNREVWQDGRLVSMDSETDDNGDAYQVRARNEGDRLLVDGSGGKLDLPGDTLTTSYWNEAAMTRGEWLGTQEGELARSAVTKKPVESVLVEGRTVEAIPYDLVGDITCSLWYADGRWVKLRFVGEDDSVIDYTLEAPQQSG